MVQKEQYIDFEEVSPSPLHFEEVQNECKMSAKPVQNLSVVTTKASVLVEKVIKRVDYKKARGAISIIAKLAFAIGISCSFFYGLYLVGVYTLRFLSEVITLFTESGFFTYVAIGGCLLLVIIILAYIIQQVNNAPRFDDWNPKRKTEKKVSDDEKVTINQTVNIYK